MGILASFLWETGKDKCYINYMALDDAAYKTLIKPRRVPIEVDSKVYERIDEAINGFFTEIKSQDNPADVLVEYKTVIKRYRKSKPREESVYVDNKLTNRIKQEKYSNKKLSSKLKNKELKFFKSALKNMGVLTSNDDANIHHLWCIALHATKKSYRRAIKKLWKKKRGIQRMNSENKKQYNEFIKETNENML